MLFGGGCYGIAGVLEKNIRFRKVGKVYKFIGIIVTFSICCFAWIFFRCSTLEDAEYIIFHIADGITEFKRYILNGYYVLDLDVYKGIQLAISIIILTIVDICQDRGMGIEYIRKMPIVIRWSLYLLLVFGILLFSCKEGVEFVYFQF